MGNYGDGIVSRALAQSEQQNLIASLRRFCIPLFNNCPSVRFTLAFFVRIDEPHLLPVLTSLVVRGENLAYLKVCAIVGEHSLFFHVDVVKSFSIRNVQPAEFGWYRCTGSMYAPDIYARTVIVIFLLPTPHNGQPNVRCYRTSKAKY